MRFFEPVLCSHDKAQVETYCYADGGRADAISERLMRAAHALDRHPPHRRRDRLADPPGRRHRHRRRPLGPRPGGRPLVFSKRPGPVTLELAGPGHPTGAAELDHFLTDAVAWPEAGARPAAGAQPYRLAGGLLAFQPLSQLPDPGPLPASRLGHVTFGLQGDLR